MEEGSMESAISKEEMKEWLSRRINQFHSMDLPVPLKPKLTLLCRRMAFARRNLDTLHLLDAHLPERFRLLRHHIGKISPFPSPDFVHLLSPMVDALQELHKVNGMLSLKASAFSDPYPHHRLPSIKPSFDDLPSDPFLRAYANRDPYLDSCASADFLQLFQGLDHRGKYLLMCFSVFPAGALVDKRSLAYWCMAMGVLHPSEHLLERAVDRILEDLVVKGFVEAEEHNFKLVRFKLCPFVRCFAVKVAERFGFYSFDNKGAPSSPGEEPGKFFLTTTIDGTRSSIDDLRKDDGRLHKIECVFNVNERFPDFDPQDFEKMETLGALCLGRSSADQHIEMKSLDFLGEVEVVKNLTVLSLRGVSMVVQLPDALCKHAVLRVLDLHSCHNLETLPEGIGSLVNLTHLDISKCYLLERMPKGLASLTKLRVLKGFLVVSDQGSCAFSSLAGLTKLYKLSLYVNNIGFPGKKEQRVLRGFTLLRDFHIQWGGRAATRKTSEQSKVGKPGTVQGEVGGGLGGIDSSVAVPSTIELGNRDHAGNIPPTNEGIQTATNELLEGGQGDVVPEVRIDVFDDRKDVNMAQSIGKGLGESPKELDVSKPSVDGRLSRLLTGTGIKKNSAGKPPGAVLKSVDKLVLQCVPQEELPDWLVPINLPRLKQLHIKGGRLRGFGDSWKSEASKLEMLRLNYLREFEMDEKDLRTYFPKMSRLAKADCPKLSGFPADDANIRIPLRG